MRHSVISILVALLSLGLSGCVHRDFEYSSTSEAPVDVELELQYLDLDMPIHTELDFTASRGDIPDVPTASRHIIKIYDSRHLEVASAVLTDAPENAVARRSHHLSLSPGAYTAVCWTDYSMTDAPDLYYDTTQFPNVELCCDPADADGFRLHTGSTIWRDAFSGYTEFCVEGATATSVLVEMRRPMARFVVEATDFDEFATRHGISPLSVAPEAQPLSGYDILFRYAEYMPSIFSARNDAPVDSRVGASFSGVPCHASSGNGAIELGSDFVFVHPLETSVRLALEVRNAATGELVGRAGPFTVPLLRNHLTILRGRFLTSQSGSAIIIDTGFDGEYNIEI